MSGTIIVSGPCVHRMKSSLGAEQIHYKNLLDLLSKTMGASCCVKPVITTRLPHSSGEKNGIRKEMAAAGFHIHTMEQDERDSDCLIRLIDSIDPAKASSLALLTGHDDVLPAVCRLVSKGVQKIFWAGTASPLGFKRSGGGLSPDTTVALLEQSVCFVNLGQHRRQITKGALQQSILSFHDEHPDESEYQVSFKCKDRKRHVELGNAIRRLSQDFPGLTFKAVK